MHKGTDLYHSDLASESKVKKLAALMQRKTLMAAESTLAAHLSCGRTFTNRASFTSPSFFHEHCLKTSIIKRFDEYVTNPHSSPSAAFQSNSTRGLATYTSTRQRRDHLDR